MPGHRLVGRRAELGVLDEWLDDGARLVTILGPAGVGKTRLAQAGFARRRTTGTAAYYCSWAGERDLDRARRQLAEVIGSGDARIADSSLGLAQALAARGQCIVVIDNLEQLLPAARDELELWLRVARELTVVATSRHAIGTSGERLLELGPLPVPTPDSDTASDAVELLVDAVSAFRPGWAPSAVERRQLGELARHLEGLPLALEIASARLRVLSLPALLARVQDHRVLLGGPGAALVRAIDASWQMLAANERTAFARCAVFRGGFTADDAEAVISEPGDQASTLDLVHALRDKSLLFARSQDEVVQLHMYVAIRAFAAERLDERPDHAETVIRHARRFVDEARNVAPGDQRVRDNLRAAVEALAELPDTAERVALSLDAVGALDHASGGAALTSHEAELVERVLDQAARHAALLTPVLVSVDPRS